MEHWNEAEYHQAQACIEYVPEVKVVPSPPASTPKISFIHGNSVIVCQNTERDIYFTFICRDFVMLEQGFFTLPKDTSWERSVHVTHFLSNCINMPCVKYIFKLYSPPQKYLLCSRCILAWYTQKNWKFHLYRVFPWCSCNSNSLEKDACQ